jgi:lysophospholipase L1-like esterase
MNDSAKAALLLAAAGIVFFAGWKLLAKSGSKALRGARRIACLGDSITAAGMYCSDLAGILGVQTKAFGYQGKGVGAIGSHVPEVLAWKPDAVVVLAGVNDLPSKDGDDVAISGLAKIYARIRADGVPVVAVEILPWHGYPSAAGHETNTDVVNAWIRGAATVDAVVRTGTLGDYAGRLKDQYSAGDGLHLNREGHAQLAALIADQAFGG